MRQSMEICRICGSGRTEVTYEGIIRDGGLGKYTENPVKMWRCKDCNAMWHESMVKDVTEYYESKEYRLALEDSTEENDFYRLHDKESLDKFLYTGTTIFRNKTVADIGCGCGAFLDYVKGVAKNIVAIEPSAHYRDIMTQKGFDVYPYSSDALKDYSNSVDVIVSFDVIEHVEDPTGFVSDVYNLLSDGGHAIIGTPTDAPVMRGLLGNDYEKKLLFSTQHLWILGEKSLGIIAGKFPFADIYVKYFQRYGLANLLGWARDKKPNSGIGNQWITETMDNVWRREVENRGLSDYIVLYLSK